MRITMVSQPEPLTDWVKSLRGLEQTRQFSLAKFEGIRGVVADEPIGTNDIVLTVPEDLAIQTANNRPPTFNADFVSQNVWGGSKWDQRIGYKVAVTLYLYLTIYLSLALPMSLSLFLCLFVFLSIFSTSALCLSDLFICTHK